MLSNIRSCNRTAPGPPYGGGPNWHETAYGADACASILMRPRWATYGVAQPQPSGCHLVHQGPSHRQGSWAACIAISSMPRRSQPGKPSNAKHTWKGAQEQVSCTSTHVPRHATRDHTIPCNPLRHTKCSLRISLQQAGMRALHPGSPNRH